MPFKSDGTVSRLLELYLRKIFKQVTVTENALCRSINRFIGTFLIVARVAIATARTMHKGCHSTNLVRVLGTVVDVDRSRF